MTAVFLPTYMHTLGQIHVDIQVVLAVLLVIALLITLIGLGLLVDVPAQVAPVCGPKCNFTAEYRDNRAVKL